MRSTFGVAAYRFRATFRHRRGGYLVLVLLLGIVGGVALGAIAGARRTQASFSTYVASINPFDLEVFTAIDNPALGFSNGYSPATGAQIARLPFVRSIETVVGFDGNLDYVNKAHINVGPAAKPPAFEGSLGGEYTTRDSAHLVAGRFADPASTHEAVMNAQAAREMGLHVGSVIQVALNSDAQESLLGSPTGPSSLPPAQVADVRMVGMVVFPQDVALDDYDALGTATVLFPPALTRELASCCAYYSYATLKVDGGRAHVKQVEAEISRRVRVVTGSGGGFMTIAPVAATANRSIKPESVALAVFGALAGVAALVIALQVLGRQLRLQSDELDTLRALGARPVTITAAGLIGPLLAALAGSAAAVVVAIALSPLFPLGPVRPVYPIGVAFDWAVLGLGFALMVVVLAAVGIALGYRNLLHHLRRRGEPDRPSGATRIAVSSGLPTTAVTGIRFAVEPGDRRDPVPVRSAILGAMLAVLVVVATVTFGASLHTLVSHPNLYGWNWNYALMSGFSGDEDLPAQQSATLLRQDRYVAAASGVYFVHVRIDGEDFPAIGASPNSAVAPPLLAGHGLDAPNQIVLGPSTLAMLHERLGGTVEVIGGRGGTSVRLTIVGTATMPAIMSDGMGIGAVVDYHLVPASVLNTQGSAVPGPNAFLIRTRGDPAAALRSLNNVNKTINLPSSPSPGSAGGVVGVLRPEEIVDSHSIEVIPAVLGAGLSAGALAALGITLVASVRRRRRDLAVLKVLGLSGRQLASVVAWQSSVAAVIGTAVGVPLGIVVGRLLWYAFADLIHAVPSPTVPVLSVVLVALGAVVLANVVATVPGRLAARTPTGLLLRAE